MTIPYIYLYMPAPLFPEDSLLKVELLEQRLYTFWSSACRFQTSFPQGCIYLHSHQSALPTPLPARNPLFLNCLYHLTGICFVTYLWLFVRFIFFHTFTDIWISSAVNCLFMTCACVGVFPDCGFFTYTINVQQLSQTYRGLCACLKQFWLQKINRVRQKKEWLQQSWRLVWSKQNILSSVSQHN